MACPDTDIVKVKLSEVRQPAQFPATEWENAYEIVPDTETGSPPVDVVPPDVVPVEVVPVDLVPVDLVTVAAAAGLCWDAAALPSLRETKG